MERESAVREILQSIGPLFPEDAARARAARKQQAENPFDVPAEAPAAAEPRVRLTTAPKPMLASQVDSPNGQKVPVVNLAAVLDRLTSNAAPPPMAASVRDAVPDLVRPAVPDINALRAALDARDGTVTPPASVLEAPAPTIETPDPVAPMAAEEEVAAAEPAIAPIDEEPTEAMLDSFVTAVADAILPTDLEAPLEPFAPAPEPLRAATAETAAEAVAAEAAVKPEVVAQPELTAELATAPAATAEHEPVAGSIPGPVAVEAPVARRVAATKSNRRGKHRKAAAQPTLEPPSLPTVPETAASTTEDDELMRQIRTHRADMIDVDEQVAKLDQQIASEKQEMARYVARVEQKSAYRARLLRLRGSTQRFVETLQIKAEPVKRQPKKQAQPA